MVNTQDIKDFEKEQEIIVYKDIVKQIFDKQNILLQKYRRVEGLPDTFNLHSAETQKIIKEFVYRGIEELAEAQEAIDKQDEEHFLEEISDAIHFFTETMLVAGITSEEINNCDNIETIYPFELTGSYTKFWEITYRFGIACNLLKNKPWKVSQVQTDVKNFKKRLILAYNTLMNTLISGFNIPSKQLLDIYIDKNNVNVFRIRSKY